MRDLKQLIADALSLMNPAFVDPAVPASVLCEFYHQFRKLWDRGIPVGMGLGHLLIKPLDTCTLGIHRLGEGGRPNEALAAVRYKNLESVPDYTCTCVISFENAESLHNVTVFRVRGGTVDILE